MEHLLFVGSVHALFTAFFLITKRGRSLNDGVLALWLVFMALPMISGAIVQTWPDVYIPILRADLIYPLTYGPFMWLYAGTLTGDVNQITWRHLVHFLPFIIVSFVQLVTGWAPAPPNPEVSTFSTSIRIIGAVNLVFLLAYTTLIFSRLRRHDRMVVEHFSNLPNHITLGWVRGITAFITFVFLLLFLAAFLSLPWLMGIHLFALIVTILGLSFFGLQQDQVFDNNERPEEKIPENEIQHHTKQQKGTTPQYSRSGLTSERAVIIAQRLEAFMNSEQPYLDADLTIETLSRRLAVPRHHLTEVISKRYGKNFYLFVNEYRIQA